MSELSERGRQFSRYADHRARPVMREMADCIDEMADRIDELELLVDAMVPEQGPPVGAKVYEPKSVLDQVKGKFLGTG